MAHTLLLIDLQALAQTIVQAIAQTIVQTLAQTFVQVQTQALVTIMHLLASLMHLATYIEGRLDDNAIQNWIRARNIVASFIGRKMLSLRAIQHLIYVNWRMTIEQWKVLLHSS
jgi:hypothetical protein